MRLIDNIEGEPIVEQDDYSVTFKAKAAIDSDGTGPHHGDRTAQDDTTLHESGKPLNADVDRYIVVPPQIRDGVKGVVVGCQAYVVNTQNQKSTAAVVGDIGPHHKLGEISCACAVALGLNPSPVDGGTDEHIIKYLLIPGVPAVVDGKYYHLQPHYARS
jgi:hypothetical protein